MTGLSNDVHAVRLIDSFHLQAVTSNVLEARGLIADMIAKNDLPMNVVTCLRAVASLLQPPSVREII